MPSVLGVDGYNPSIIQYEANSTSAPAVPSNDANSVPSKRSSESSSTSTNSVPAPIKKISKPSTKPSVAVDITPAQKVDSAIQTISRYRTGGDGGAALKLLITFVRNIVQNPTEEK